MVKQLLKAYLCFAFSLMYANESSISKLSDINELNLTQEDNNIAHFYKNMWLQDFSKLSIEEQKFILNLIQNYCSLVHLVVENKDIYKKIYLNSQDLPHEGLTDKEKNVIGQFESLQQYFIDAFNHPLRRTVEKYFDAFSDITGLSKIMDTDNAENICTITQDKFATLDAYMHEFLEGAQAIINTRL